MSLKIANDTANGNVILKGKNVSGDRTITMPNLDCELAPRMQLMTAQNSTSGTSIDFTGIPSWAKKITVMFAGVSTNGTSNPLFQLGSASVATSGYLGAGGNQSSSVATNNYTTGIGINSNSASNILHGISTFTNLVGNLWVCTITGGLTAQSTFYSFGTVTLSGTLDRIRITTVNGTDTFDAGQINVLYEG